MKDYNIGIIGYGFVGKAVAFSFEPYCNLFINDPKYNLSVTKREVVEHCPFIFVAVPTPYSIEKKEFNKDIISEVIQEVDQYALEFSKKPVLIIKSAVTPAITQELILISPHIHIVISPEFLRAKHSVKDYINAKCMILGGDEKICQRVVNLYKNHSICDPEVKVGICSAVDASFIKYMENSWLAMKVIFLSQIKDFYEKIVPKEDQNYNHLINMHHLDERMGTFPHEYTIPGPDGHKGFGGLCLPKDVNSLIAEARQVDVDLSLLKKCWEINLMMREDRDWETLPGAFNT